MNKSSILIRDDGKQFNVVNVAHWSDIISADGERDCVKWYGGISFVGAVSGHTYVLKDQS
jgi:hypothetical protein